MDFWVVIEAKAVIFIVIFAFMVLIRLFDAPPWTFMMLLLPQIEILNSTKKLLFRLCISDRCKEAFYKFVPMQFLCFHLNYNKEQKTGSTEVIIIQEDVERTTQIISFSRKNHKPATKVIDNLSNHPW